MVELKRMSISGDCNGKEQSFSASVELTIDNQEVRSSGMGESCIKAISSAMLKLFPSLEKTKLSYRVVQREGDGITLDHAASSVFLPGAEGSGLGNSIILVFAKSLIDAINKARE